jgi:hypothetical protein
VISVPYIENVFIIDELLMKKGVELCIHKDWLS